MSRLDLDADTLDELWTESSELLQKAGCDMPYYAARKLIDLIGVRVLDASAQGLAAVVPQCGSGTPQEGIA